MHAFIPQHSNFNLVPLADVVHLRVCMPQVHDTCVQAVDRVTSEDAEVSADGVRSGETYKQRSSGVIICTGTGSTAWMSSASNVPPVSELASTRPSTRSISACLLVCYVAPSWSLNYLIDILIDNASDSE
jgi:hypothetical protein